MGLVTTEAGTEQRRRPLPVKKQGNVVKDFKIGKTRIKVNDAYCRDKTSADVEAILARIAIRAQEQLTAQEIAKRENRAT